MPSAYRVPIDDGSSAYAADIAPQARSRDLFWTVELPAGGLTVDFAGQRALLRERNGVFHG